MASAGVICISRQASEITVCMLEVGPQSGANPEASATATIESINARAEAKRRGDILVKGLGGKLGRMRATSLGVYQITPRNSTDVSDYGVNDTSSRLKDVRAVVSARFAVKS